MPIHPDSSGNYTAFTVYINAISLSPQAGSPIFVTNSSFSEPVVLESSTTLIYLPDEVVAQIYSLFNVERHTISGAEVAFADCKYSNSSYMSFTFESGSVINVPYSEIVSKYDVSPSLVSQLNSNLTDVCFFSILPATE